MKKQRTNQKFSWITIYTEPPHCDHSAPLTITTTKSIKLRLKILNCVNNMLLFLLLVFAVHQGLGQEAAEDRTDHSHLGVNCKVSLPPANGEILEVYPGYYLRYFCKPGYLLYGTATNICDKGTWLKSTPLCLAPRCRPISAIDNGKVVTHLQGAVLTFTCDEGHEFEPGSNIILVCDGAGAGWNATAPSCLPSHWLQNPEARRREEYFLSVSDTSCAAQRLYPPHLIHGSLAKYAQLRYRGRYRLIAEYRCLDGYRLLDDSKTLYCSRKQWVGPMPVCVKDLGFTSCAENNGGCQQICMMIGGNRIQCQCYDGFRLAPGGKKCEDVDECARADNGGCEHTCTNRAGGVECVCNRGYIVASDGQKCLDVDECSFKHGGCSNICTNQMGGHTCSCPEDMELLPGNKTCKAIPKICGSVMPPLHGFVSPPACLTGQVLMGFQCRYSCHPGFRLRGISLTLCTPMQTWSGAKPTCAAIASGMTHRNCPKGSYMDRVTRQCQLCPAGTYQDRIGQYHCRKCPGDHDVSIPGAIAVEACVPALDPDLDFYDEDTGEEEEDGGNRRPTQPPPHHRSQMRRGQEMGKLRITSRRATTTTTTTTATTLHFDSVSPEGSGSGWGDDNDDDDDEDDDDDDDEVDTPRIDYYRIRN